MRNKLGFWLLSLGGLALVISLAFPFLVPSPSRFAAPPPDTTVKYNSDTGLPDWLDGPLPYILSADEQADPEQAARNILNRFRDVFGIADANAEFQLVRIDTDPLGQTHVRLQQVKDGIPVWGRVLLVHLGEGRALGINGDYQPGLSLTTSPGLTAGQAEALALATDTGTDPQADGSQLMIYVDSVSQQGYLTWFVRVEALITHATGYFVDAQDGTVRHITPLAAGDLYREVYDLQGKDNFPGKLLATEGTVPRDPDGAAAYKNAGIVYKYFLDKFKRDSFDDNGANLYLLIHSPELGNSFWNGEVMVFGDADGYIASKNDALVLDIMAHELTHAVTQYTAGLEYENQSGALNESFSDVFGVMVDREDWHLFEDNTVCSTFPKGHCWMRDMQDPSLGGDYDPDNPRAGFGQPMHMNEYANLPNSREGDWGGVHINSGIPNHVLYLAATASSKEAAEQVWYRALSTYLTPRSDFSDFATALQKSAVDLYGQGGREYTAVTNALRQAGILGGAPEPTPVATTPPNVDINPTPAPVTTTGCTELVSNGTFEGSRPAPWTEHTNLSAPIIAEEFPHTGRKSAWLGGTDQESFQYIYQDISIAANMRAVTLTYWHYVEENANEGAPDAEFNTLLADASGNVIADLETFLSSAPDSDWVQSTVDLSGFAGKKVRLAFTADMVRGNLSNFFVDDVGVSGCTSGGGTTTTTGGKSVTVQGTITDSRTGKPIEGAEFYILNVTVSQASADGRLTDSEVMASGISDRRGNYRLDAKLERSQSYNVVVIANGYKTLAIDDAFEITSSDPDPVVQDVVLQKR